MSAKQLARVAGVLYLIVVVCSIFSEVVGSTITVSGNAAATTANIAGHATLFRAGLLAGLVSNITVLVVALILYAILRRVSPAIALAMVVLNAVAGAIADVNGLNHLGALLIATVPGYTAGLSAPSAHALVLLAVELNRLGGLIAFVFWGLWLLPLGYLVYKSASFPKILGILLAISGSGYLVADAGSFVSPGFQWSPALYIELLGVAEILFALWLVIIGLKSEQSGRRAPATKAAA